jgi:hypothetical protein
LRTAQLSAPVAHADALRQSRLKNAAVDRAVILVEGSSDKAAIEALARRRGRALDAEGVSVVAMGGAQAIGRYLHLFGPRGENRKVAGLCDAGEVGDFQRGLERAGFGSPVTRVDMERLGFYVCDPDLEAELIRAVGPHAVVQIAAEHGDLQAFRTLQKQPAWAGRSTEEQLRRWMGSGGRRKIRYAAYLVEALNPGDVPRPLARLLDYV